MGFIVLIGLFGYVVPVPALIWGWVRWLRSKSRFTSPVWRNMAAFCALILASAVGLPLFLAALYAHDLRESPTRYSLEIASHMFGVAATMLALILSLAGKGPARLPATLASLGFAAFWAVMPT